MYKQLEYIMTEQSILLIGEVLYYMSFWSFFPQRLNMILPFKWLYYGVLFLISRSDIFGQYLM